MIICCLAIDLDHLCSPPPFEPNLLTFPKKQSRFEAPLESFFDQIFDSRLARLEIDSPPEISPG